MPSGFRRASTAPRPSSRHLPPGGFGVVRRRDPAVALLRRHQREDLGLCPYCGSSADGDTIACIPCLAVAAAARRRLKAGRRARGLCPCGALPAPGFKLCSRCLGHAAKRRAANRSRGLCICGAPATPGYLTCAGCRERAAARHARLRAAGICLRCPAPARPGLRLCARCAAAAVVASSRGSGSGLPALNERRKRDPGRRRDQEPLRPSGRSGSERHPAEDSERQNHGGCVQMFPDQETVKVGHSGASSGAQRVSHRIVRV